MPTAALYHSFHFFLQFLRNETFHVTTPIAKREFSPNADSTKHLGPKTCIVCNIFWMDNNYSKNIAY